MTESTSIMQFHVPLLSRTPGWNTPRRAGTCAWQGGRQERKRKKRGEKNICLAAKHTLSIIFNLVIIDLREVMNKTLSYSTIIICKGQSSWEKAPNPCKDKSWVELFRFLSPWSKFYLMFCCLLMRRNLGLSSLWSGDEAGVSLHLPSCLSAFSSKRLTSNPKSSYAHSQDP